ncbi:hypothetical protein [Ottowia sp.]|uniref:hypothetical protein n=1 Tax=Ottowia sp. TaxID=1898956 RepID=UPI0025D397DB|nr:hypothetical protein [Ottowia sp.]MBK6616306.1 hypothetical protein [Ottowia sp.]
MSNQDLNQGYPIQSVLPDRAHSGASPRDDYEAGDSFADLSSPPLRRRRIAGVKPAAYPRPLPQDQEVSDGVEVTYCERGHAFFTGVYLVRGVGKRTVKVIIRPFHGAVMSVTEEWLAEQAARIASRKGWRKVVVAPDDYGYNDARVFNMHQFFVEKDRIGHQGTFLYSLGDQGSRWH